MSNIRFFQVFSRKGNEAWLSEGKRTFLSAFPNPDRIGCPQSPIIARLALGGQNIPAAEREEWFAHLSCCSPCAQDYYGHLEAARNKHKQVLLLLCAALVIVCVGISLWFGLRTNGIKSPVMVHKGISSPANKKISPSVPKVDDGWVYARLDLRPQSAIRGEDALEKALPAIPHGKLELMITLPLASPVGAYEIRVSPGNSASARMHDGAAELVNHLTILNVRIETNDYPTGRYVMEIRRKGGSWSRYFLNIK